MKRLICILVLLLFSPVLAQENPALLLFTRYNSETEIGELYVLNATTGEERFLTTAFSDAGWSPDGRVWVVDDNENERHLRFFDTQTGEESSFAAPLYANPCDAGVFWSPNGQQMAYISNTGDEYFLNVQNLSDESLYQLAASQYQKPYWSPDSQYFYYGFDYRSTNSELFSAEDGSLVFSSPNKMGIFSPDSHYLSYWDEAGLMYLYELATGESVQLLATERGYWSPNGRYFALENNLFTSPARTLSYYDNQNQSFENIELGFVHKFAAWMPDENAVLLYTDFVEWQGKQRPTSLIHYDLASGEMEMVLEDSFWISGIHQSGDWIAIRYSTILTDEPGNPTSDIILLTEEQRYDFELILGNGGLRAGASGFLLDAEGGLYFFDNQTAILETIALENTDSPFWAADERYVAFTSHFNDNPNAYLSILNMEAQSINHFLESEAINQIIGWQGSRQRKSLLNCGEG